MTATDTATRDEWLAWRRAGIGASDVAAILGISPWASPWSLWADKSGLLGEEPENTYMIAGRWLEAAIAPWFTDVTGLHVAGQQTWCSGHYEWTAGVRVPRGHHRCTVDGFVFEGPIDDVAISAYMDDALGCLEIKILGPARRWATIPEHYQAQGQWQMHVTGLDNVWFAVLHGRRLEVYELARDQADIDFMVQRVEAFWHDHVLTGVPPAVDASDATARALAAVYPEHTPGASVEIQWGHVDAWLDAKLAVKADQREVEFHANAIKAELGDAEEGTVGGQRVVSWRTQHRKPYTVAEADFRVLRSHTTKETP